MALTFQPYPFDLRGLPEWLVDAAPLKDEVPELSGVGPLEIIGPLPSYYEDARLFLKGGAESSKQTGWRALVRSEGNPIAVLDIVLSTAGQPRYGLRGKAAAIAFEQALLSANKAGAKEHYQVRWLSLADIYVTVVWLSGTRDLFIPTRLGNSERVQPREMTLDRLQAIVRKLVEQSIEGDSEEFLRGRLWSTRSPTSGLPKD